MTESQPQNIGIIIHSVHRQLSNNPKWQQTVRIYNELPYVILLFNDIEFEMCFTFYI